MADRLTETQQAIFDMIVDYLKDHGVAPSVRDIAEDFGINSTNGVVCHLDALERKGYIGRHPNVSRGIYIRLGNVCPCCGQAVKAVD